MANAYQPLATKYRPQTFEDVVGQEVVSTTLQNAIRGGRISHAYLFSGMRGVGKTTTARLLAKCLNCRTYDKPTTTPCGTCESCTEVAAGRSIDVLEIDAASNTSVDDVRALQENLIYAPARDRYKVYIVDEVHMLSKSAFNAFLKTLEEPPDHVAFIFATTEINKIPPTVLSRCLVFDFSRVSSNAIADRLRWICEQEGVKAEDAAIDLIVFQSEGSIRDAISALDQVINFAAGDVKYDHALQALGLIDREVLHRLTNAVIDQDAVAAFDAIRSVSDIGADMRLFCRHLIRHIRDLLIIRVGGATRELLPYSEDEIKLLEEQAGRVSEEDLTRFFDILVRADEEMQFAATPQYHLEAAAVKMIHTTRLTPLAELIARLEGGEIAAPRAVPRPVEKEQSLDFGNSTPVATPAGNPRDRLLTAAKDTEIATLLKPAKSIALDAGELIITVSSQGQVRMLSTPPKSGVLDRVAHEAFGESIRVTVKNGGASAVVEPDTEEEDSEPEPAPVPQPPVDSAPPPTDDDLPVETAEEEQPEEAYTAPAAPTSGDSEKEKAEKKLRSHPLAAKLFNDLPGLEVGRVHKIRDDEEE